MTGRVLVTALASTVLVSTSSADSSVSRIVDRTFSCATGYLGGVYQVEVWAGKAIPRAGGPKKYGFTVIHTNLPEFSLGGFEQGAVWVSRRNCRPTETSGPFSRSGLRGGTIGVTEKRIDCFTARTVLIRIRGEFARPTTLRTATPYGFTQLRAAGVLRRAEVSVKAPTGRRLAYASVDAHQRTTLYTAPDCEED